MRSDQHDAWSAAAPIFSSSVRRGIPCFAIFYAVIVIITARIRSAAGMWRVFRVFVFAVRMISFWRANILTPFDAGSYNRFTFFRVILCGGNYSLYRCRPWSAVYCLRRSWRGTVLPPFVCLSGCLSISRVTQKAMGWCSCNLGNMWIRDQRRVAYIGARKCSR